MLKRFDGVVSCLRVEWTVKETVFNSFLRSSALHEASVNKFLVQIANSYEVEALRERFVSDGRRCKSMVVTNGYFFGNIFLLD